MRRQYPFHLIEPKWRRFWEAEATFRAWNPGDIIPAEHPFAKRHGLSGKVPADRLPRKFYILDMFPYPSGAGLHVGHPEGYTATDILARYRRACGCNVLHPMGWDAFGLPAEQYAIRTGQHPRKTTEENIAVFKRQIQSLGFSYDWAREIDTTDPRYFRWTQWIFLQFYNSWFNPATGKAEPIETLPVQGEGAVSSEALRQYRDSQRLAYVSEAPVWWCEELGTVLANEEVIDGKSEVGGFPVVRRPMRQWMLRITAYADRLLARVGANRLERIAQGNAAQLDRPQRRGGSAFSAGRRSDEANHGFHDAAGHVVWRHLHGAFAGAQAGRGDHHAGTTRGGRGLQDRGRQEERPGTDGTGPRKDGRFHRRLRGQSCQY